MIVKATPNEPANDIIKRAGIETSESLTQVWWEYNGERILRPLVNRWEEVVFEKWGIKIEYIDEEQLKLFV